MFKLYINLEKWERVRVSDIKKNGKSMPFFTEEQVIEMMQLIASKRGIYYFMIIERIENSDRLVTITRNEEDFNKYIESYYNRKVEVEDMTCLELKDFITKRVLSKKRN